MKKITRNEMWELSISVAEQIKKQGISNIMEMTQDQMAIFDKRIAEMPKELSIYDGKDYEEDDTFEYFKVLVKFQLACMG